MPVTPVCAPETSTLTAIKAPIDIVVVVDNSTSMVQEFEELSLELNRTLYEDLEAAGADYKVSLITEAGPEDLAFACLVSPLGPFADLNGDGYCESGRLDDLLDAPEDSYSAENFVHLNVEVDGREPLCTVGGDTGRAGAVASGGFDAFRYVD